jgi:hypothetical protein
VDNETLQMRVLAYRELVASFLGGNLAPETFARQFEKLYLQDAIVFPSAMFDVLETLFGVCDSFVSDPQARSELKSQHPAMYVTEGELREATADALATLNEYIRKSGSDPDA